MNTQTYVHAVDIGENILQSIIYNLIFFDIELIHSKKLFTTEYVERDDKQSQFNK